MTYNFDSYKEQVLSLIDAAHETDDPDELRLFVGLACILANQAISSYETLAQKTRELLEVASP